MKLDITQLFSNFIKGVVPTKILQTIWALTRDIFAG